MHIHSHYGYFLSGNRAIVEGGSTSQLGKPSLVPWQLASIELRRLLP